MTQIRLRIRDSIPTEPPDGIWQNLDQAPATLRLSWAYRYINPTIKKHRALWPDRGYYHDEMRTLAWYAWASGEAMQSYALDDIQRTRRLSRLAEAHYSRLHPELRWRPLNPAYQPELESMRDILKSLPPLEPSLLGIQYRGVPCMPELNTVQLEQFSARYARPSNEDITHLFQIPPSRGLIAEAKRLARYAKALYSGDTQ